MKKILFQIFLLIAVLFTACEEQPIEIKQTTIDTDRKILIEEFTGANCAACPAGAKTIENLRDVYGDKIIAVSIHTTVSGALGKPIEGSSFDLRTSYGDDLASLFGGLSGIPAAVFNRTKFSDQSKMAVLSPDSWANYVIEELEQDPILDIETELEYDDATRMLTINVTATPVVDQEGDFRIGVIMTENEIVDFQNDSGTIDSVYHHEHILRVIPDGEPTDDVLPAIDGDPLATSFTVNLPITKTYTIQIPETIKPSDLPDNSGIWVVENLNIITYVSEVNSEDGTIKVLQANEEHLGE